MNSYPLLSDGVFTYVASSVTRFLGYTVDEFLTHFRQYLTDHPTNLPRAGVARHVDAGYDEAIACAEAKGIAIPRRRGAAE